jgi:hypothetical protein
VTLLALSGGAARGMPLTYTQFVADVGGPIGCPPAPAGITRLPGEPTVSTIRVSSRK